MVGVSQSPIHVSQTGTKAQIFGVCGYKPMQAISCNSKLAQQYLAFNLCQRFLASHSNLSVRQAPLVPDQGALLLLGWLVTRQTKG